MSLTKTPAIFGSPRRTEVLTLIALLEETYPRELARLLGARLLTIQQIVESLESEGMISTRLVGRQRRVTLNERFYGAKQLRDLLLKLGEANTELQAIVTSIRRRPRTRSSPL
jgi:hypothetical protein